MKIEQKVIVEDKLLCQSDGLNEYKIKKIGMNVCTRTRKEMCFRVMKWQGSMRRNLKVYNEKYSKGDFKHRKVSDNAFIQALIKKYGIKKNTIILDLGCGTGGYTNLFRKYGMQVYGIDFSKVGIQKAKDTYEEMNLVVGDGTKLPFKHDSFDILFCSGFSPFSVEDLDEVKWLGERLMEHLADNGLFIFVWTTNLSDKRAKSTRMNHTPEKIKKYFDDLNCGEVIGLYTTYPQLFPIFGRYASSRIFTIISSEIARIFGLRNRLICVVKKHKRRGVNENLN